jgi:hypothetical protein
MILKAGRTYMAGQLLQETIGMSLMIFFSSWIHLISLVARFLQLNLQLEALGICYSLVRGQATNSNDLEIGIGNAIAVETHSLYFKRASLLEYASLSYKICFKVPSRQHPSLETAFVQSPPSEANELINGRIAIPHCCTPVSQTTNGKKASSPQYAKNT